MRFSKLLVVVLLATIPAAAFAAFADVPGSSPFATAINGLQDRGTIGGYPDGSFRPMRTINRAELLKILVGASGANPAPAQYHDCFPDVHQEWFAPYVCYAREQGWVQGYADGFFRPDNVLVEAEALKMIVVSLHAAPAPAQCDRTFWYSTYLCTANRAGLLRTTSFDAAAPMTRGLSAEWMYNAPSPTTTPQSSSAAASAFSSATSSAAPVSSSASANDALPTYAQIKAVYESMTAQLQTMQTTDLHAIGQFFGQDDVDELTSIQNQYARNVNVVVLVMNDAQSFLLSPQDIQQFNAAVAQATELSSRFSELLQRYHDALTGK
jgi:hypothetical protein